MNSAAGYESDMRSQAMTIPGIRTNICVVFSFFPVVAVFRGGGGGEDLIDQVLQVCGLTERHMQCSFGMRDQNIFDKFRVSGDNVPRSLRF